MTDRHQLDAFLPEWTQLFEASGTHNPFAHPLWLITWARHFVPSGQLRVVTTRNAVGELVGIAPFYLQNWAMPLGPGAGQLRLLGTGRHAHLTELPQILTAPDPKHLVLRELLRFVSGPSGDWDWLEVGLTPEQGWFEPIWLPPDGGARSPGIIHMATRPCVILPLPPTWEEFRRGLKRNVKESIRRGANRLERAGHNWDVVVPDDLPALRAALDQILDLHRRRSRLTGKPHHADYFADPADRAFFHDVSQRMFSAGHLSPYLLRVDGTPVAARLVLRANGGCFFSASGLDPAWWAYSPGTTLMAAILKAEIGRGTTVANLSLGPDETKLRWSERVEAHHDFLVVGPRRRSRLACGLFRLHRTTARIRQEHRPG